jgi:hypothetical protein
MTARREPISINPEVREDLRDLLLGHHFEGSGAGYSAVVKAAVDLARGNREFRDRIKAAQFQVTELDRWESS